MSQQLIEHCDRCNEQEPLAADLRIQMGGRTFGSQLFYDLCADCLADLREFLHTQPR